jgi:hypothetical protein
MNQNLYDVLSKQKELESIIKNYQAPKEYVEWRILNENEEVDNLYVQTKTCFINDSTMVLKGVDGSLEKWDIKKTYPIDKKDLKINELEEEIRKLKEMMNNEHAEFDSTTRELNESNADANGNVKSKPKTSSKSVSGEE